jgi:apolipoprotein N-acyltransferase
MTPRVRTHLITAALFAGVVLVLALLWWLRNVFVYLLLGAVALVAYYGLYLLVASRLKTRAAEERPPERPDDDLE